MKAFLQRLPLIRDFLAMRDASVALARTHRDLLALAADAAVRDLLESPKYADTRRLARYEGEVFSQSGEDGILSEIFRRIGTSNRHFVEIGVGDGLENNTTYLLARGWRGAWFEGSGSALELARRHFHDPVARGDLRIAQTIVTAETIGASLAEAAVPEEFDLLSIDVDRNTYYVWEALGAFHPRVVVVEYNSTVPPADEWVVAYDPAKFWNRSNYFGASLKSYELLGRRLGYALVGCGLAGTNAFFVRDDLVGHHFAPPYTAENHYEPPRYWLARVRAGHRRCFAD
ncbi:MAG TPA: hypothetical protein VMY76_16100 [Gemmatimonadales bacterium]|nr:hypothetical protein [Gemmatimonadales bacterium]